MLHPSNCFGELEGRSGLPGRCRPPAQRPRGHGGGILFPGRPVQRTRSDAGPQDLFGPGSCLPVRSGGRTCRPRLQGRQRNREEAPGPCDAHARRREGSGDAEICRGDPGQSAAPRQMRSKNLAFLVGAVRDVDQQRDLVGEHDHGQAQVALFSRVVR